MRNQPPDNFDFDAYCAAFFSFQQWELFPGKIVRGAKDVKSHMSRLQIPERLDGARVLDIAPWNGFFGFECLRRGAAEVVSLGPDDPDVTGYNKTRELLQADNCTYVRASVYDLSPGSHGHFDVVLFLGLIYHLRHPLLALDRIFDIASDRLFVDSPVIDGRVFDKTVGEPERKRILAAGKDVHQLPMIYFTKGNETGDPYNWFLPNKRALLDWIDSSGFKVASFQDDGGSWASVSATKGARSFAPGLEGWNEAASKQRSLARDA